MRFKQLGQIFHHAPYVGGGIMAWPYHGTFRPRESFLHGIWLVLDDMGNYDDGDDHQPSEQQEWEDVEGPTFYTDQGD
jgi:hypothetical protein